MDACVWTRHTWNTESEALDTAEIVTGVIESYIHSGISISQHPCVLSSSDEQGKCLRRENCFMSSYSRQLRDIYACSIECRAISMVTYLAVERGCLLLEEEVEFLFCQFVPRKFCTSAA